MKDLQGNVCWTSKFMRQSLSELHGNEVAAILRVTGKSNYSQDHKIAFEYIRCKNIHSLCFVS